MNPTPRLDLATFPIGNGFRVEVYRREDRFGAGGCMSLHCDEVEVMRFDLFDPAHFHLAIKHGDAPRIYFQPGTIEQHRERALWDLEHNAAAAIAMCDSPRSINKGIDPVALNHSIPAIRLALMKATTTNPAP